MSAICEGAADEVGALGEPQDPSELAMVLERVDGIAAQQIADIRGAGELPDDEAANDALLSVLEDQRAAADEMRLALVARDQGAYEAAAADAEAVEARLSEVAEDLGVPACGP